MVYIYLLLYSISYFSKHLFVLVSLIDSGVDCLNYLYTCIVNPKLAREKVDYRIKRSW